MVLAWCARFAAAMWAARRRRSYRCSSSTPVNPTPGMPRLLAWLLAASDGDPATAPPRTSRAGVTSVCCRACTCQSPVSETGYLEFWTSPIIHQKSRLALSHTHIHQNFHWPIIINNATCYLFLNIYKYADVTDHARLTYFKLHIHTMTITLPTNFRIYIHGIKSLEHWVSAPKKGIDGLALLRQLFQSLRGNGPLDDLLSWLVNGKSFSLFYCARKRYWEYDKYSMEKRKFIFSLCRGSKQNIKQRGFWNRLLFLCCCPFKMSQVSHA